MSYHMNEITLIELSHKNELGQIYWFFYDEKYVKIQVMTSLVSNKLEYK